MGHDPFGDFFERDFMAVADMVQIYGVKQDIPLRLLGFGVRETFKRGGQRGEASKEPRPVVWFVEHPRKPMYLNRSCFETLRDRFGHGFWLPDRHQDIVYAPQRVRIEENEGGRGDTAWKTVFVRGPYANHRGPIGEKTAAAAAQAMREAGFTRDKFRRFLQQSHPEAVSILDTLEGAEPAASWPRLMAHLLDEWRREAQSDRSRPAPPARQPEPQPKAKPRDEGGHEGWPPDSDTVTHDDIPF